MGSGHSHGSEVQRSVPCGHINITGHICSVHRMKAYRSTRASRSFTPETKAKRSTAYEVGRAPDVLETRSPAVTGNRTTIRNSSSPYPGHQTDYAILARHGAGDKSAVENEIAASHCTY